MCCFIFLLTDLLILKLHFVHIMHIKNNMSSVVNRCVFLRPFYNPVSYTEVM